MLYMRWAALPSDPERSQRQQNSKRYLAERPLLRTPLAAVGSPSAAAATDDDAAAVDAEDRVEFEGGRLIVKEPMKPDDAWLRAEEADLAATAAASREKSALRAQSSAAILAKPAARHVAGMGDRRSKSALNGPSGKTARMPKLASADEVEEARKKLALSLQPHVTWTEYLARALNAAERLGDVAELKVMRARVEEKYARLTMPYADYSSYLHNNSTGLKVTKPRTTKAVEESR
jgi:hypothetical protein